MFLVVAVAFEDVSGTVEHSGGGHRVVYGERVVLETIFIRGPALWRLSSELICKDIHQVGAEAANVTH